MCQSQVGRREEKEDEDLTDDGRGGMAAGDKVDDLNAEAQHSGGEDCEESDRRDGSSG